MVFLTLFILKSNYFKVICILVSVCIEYNGFCTWSRKDEVKSLKRNSSNKNLLFLKYRNDLIVCKVGVI